MNRLCVPLTQVIGEWLRYQQEYQIDPHQEQIKGLSFRLEELDEPVTIQENDLMVLYFEPREKISPPAPISTTPPAPEVPAQVFIPDNCLFCHQKEHAPTCHYA